jgi:two-component system nitrate/nitrite response regulator NarL
MAKIKVAIVDSSPVILCALSNLLSSLDEIEVMDLGIYGSDATRIVQHGAADVLILELADVHEALVAIGNSSDHPSTRILVVTESQRVEDAVDALERGATGYIFKNGTMDEFVAAIRAVSRGDTYVAQTFAAKVVLALRAAAARTPKRRTPTLSFREEQVLQLLLQGKKNKEIASALSISEKTVKHYMSLIMQKLHARNRIEAVLAAQRLNIDDGAHGLAAARHGPASLTVA